MSRTAWTREQTIVALALYCQIPFGRINHRNPQIIKVAELIGRTPDALSMKMANISSLDPAITGTGRTGLSNASKFDRQIWEEFHNDWESAIAQADEIIGLDKLLVDEIAEDDYHADDSTTTVKTRKKQSFFRNAVLSSYGETCCISGVSYAPLLVASHIKPWRTDHANRLNPQNGLCLSVLYDKVFDLGLITLDPDYKVVVSRKLVDECSDEFSKRNLHAIHGKEIRRPERFYPGRGFLEYHREVVFVG